jgi:hypothetical protein
MSITLGVGGALSATELREILEELPLIARVGTIGPDGWPAVNPIWFEYDDGAFYVLTKERTGFCQNWRHDPRTTLCIDMPEPPYRRVMVRGLAHFLDGVDWRERGRSGVLKYLGPDGLAYFDATLHFARILVRIDPVQIATWNGAGPDRTFRAATVWRDLDGAGDLGAITDG